MKPKVSIIVPIYNMEKYLSRCMDSLLHQSYVNLEVIAVNDGSQDMSLAILERYARKDGRVVVINQPNSGVSAARNAGLLAAEGQFIGFV
ncbi:glycosyltransferase, partial [Paenibacillus sepulcri]|nr:glycosyltransferase [Paenibacillus sepulcri]